MIQFTHVKTNEELIDLQESDQNIEVVSVTPDHTDNGEERYLVVFFLNSDQDNLTLKG